MKSVHDVGFWGGWDIVWSMLRNSKTKSGNLSIGLLLVRVNSFNLKGFFTKTFSCSILQINIDNWHSIFTSTIPKILENSQNTDFLLFLDVANVWGVDYDSSLDDSNKIRSSTGIAVDWFTPVGPLNFSLTQPISKASTDKTESFRFNLGTTF